MTNNKQMFQDLVRLGQHPKKEMSDTVTVMERIGHFLDDSVSKIYKKLKKEGVSKMDASSIIAEIELLIYKKYLQKHLWIGMEDT